jgi:hypothetical protein
MQYAVSRTEVATILTEMLTLHVDWQIRGATETIESGTIVQLTPSPKKPSRHSQAPPARQTASAWHVALHRQQPGGRSGSPEWPGAHAQPPPGDGIEFGRKHEIREPICW